MDFERLGVKGADVLPPLLSWKESLDTPNLIGLGVSFDSVDDNRTKFKELLKTRNQ